MEHSGINYEQMIKTLINLSFLVLYCTFIYWLSDQPKLSTPQVFKHQDKLLHLGAYFVMGVLAWWSFKSLLNNPTALAISTLAFCSLYGWSDEWHQSFVPGRYSSLSDWIADTIGAALSIGVLSYIHFRKRNQPRIGR